MTKECEYNLRVSTSILLTSTLKHFRLAQVRKNEVLQSMSSLGRIGEVEDIAKVAAFIVSEENSFMTGADIVVDGGLGGGGQAFMNPKK